MNTFLFDFDGTLVDSMPTFVSIMLRILDENHIPYQDDIISIITPLGYVGTAQYYRKIGLDLTEEEILTVMRDQAIDAYSHTIPAKETVFSTLQTMKKRGDHLHVLTASPHSMLDPCLKRLGIDVFFENIWSCDDFNTTKSDPKIYEMAAAKIGCPQKDILFVDDNYHAIKTAKYAGVKTCGIYDATSEQYEQKIRSLADYYVRTFSELLLI